MVGYKWCVCVVMRLLFLVRVIAVRRTRRSLGARPTVTRRSRAFRAARRCSDCHSPARRVSSSSVVCALVVILLEARGCRRTPRSSRCASGCRRPGSTTRRSGRSSSTPPHSLARVLSSSLPRLVTTVVVSRSSEDRSIDRLGGSIHDDDDESSPPPPPICRSVCLSCRLSFFVFSSSSGRSTRPRCRCSRGSAGSPTTWCVRRVVRRRVHTRVHLFFSPVAMLLRTTTPCSNHHHRLFDDSTHSPRRLPFRLLVIVHDTGHQPPHDTHDTARSRNGRNDDA